MTRIHIACSARNAAPWLDDFVESLVAQSHRDWVLWIRDDGSTDDTWATIQRWRAREPRVAQAFRGAESLGVAQGFGFVIARLPADAEVVATGDADDVWLPRRLEATLQALQAAERAHPGPVLVHTDLRVVDARLAERAPSLWRAAAMDPRQPTLREVAIANVAVAPTLLFNAPLLALVREFPAEALWQDWWLALVALANGRLVPVEEPTVLYRQHGGNAVGARPTGLGAARRAVTAWARRTQVRADLDGTARQAAALLARFEGAMSAADARELRGLAEVATLRGWRRKAAIARHRWHPRHGALRNLGVLLRG